MALHNDKSKIYLREYTWREFKELCIDREPCVVIQPTGSIEQHGLHLPLGTDTLISLELAIRAAIESNKKGFRVIVNDPVSFGVSEMWLNNPGTLSIGFNTYLNFIKELIYSLSRTGFRYIIVLNGHAGNGDILKIALRSIADLSSNDKRFYLINWWEFIGDVIDREFESGFYHADEVETSLAYALGIRVEKSMIRSEEIRRRYSNKWHPLKLSIRPKIYSYSNERYQYEVGAFGKPDHYSYDKGAKLVDIFIQRFIEFLKDIFEESI